jgi:hypothetical protein
VSSLLAEGQGVGAATPGMRSCPLRLLLTRGSSPVGRSKEASPHGGRRLLRFAACAPQSTGQCLQRPLIAFDAWLLALGR